ncbi:L-lactate permease [Neorhizobium huautlense]|uniref:L-lactate permease n=1 Tax=Neorhizobium huautlense TaxID=67774 RepID=UPI000CFA226D|nr:L-lactate permease [Neorhizobium huautlense]
MLYFVWALPALIVIALLASGRASTLGAAIIGLLVAVVVALTAAPERFQLFDGAFALLRGAWIGWIVVPYILGGLLFWQMAIRPGDAAMPVEGLQRNRQGRRRLLFSACFLIGPFSESATGFGVGIVGTMLLLRKLDLQPVPLMAFSLISQTMILWGGMGNGAIVAGAFSHSDPTALAVNASFFQLALNVLWLPMFWRMAEKAGVGAPIREHLSEVLWLGGSILLLIAATHALGPEVAMLCAYGPVIVLRYVADERPDKERMLEAMERMTPFALLIGWLLASRLVLPLSQFLQQTGRLEPFVGAPGWSPLFHAGTWLTFGALLCALFYGHVSSLKLQAREAWKTGRLSVLAIIIFSMMAEILSSSGIASALAEGMHAAIGTGALACLTLISAAFGALANSGNAANGLFMGSQVSLATEAGLNVAAVIALQHTAALALNLISPVRMSIVCSLAGCAGRERAVYRAMMPFAVVIVIVLLTGSLLITLEVV